jgi:hypothetical protein
MKKFFILMVFLFVSFVNFGLDLNKFWFFNKKIDILLKKNVKDYKDYVLLKKYFDYNFEKLIQTKNKVYLQKYLQGILVLKTLIDIEK